MKPSHSLGKEQSKERSNVFFSMGWIKYYSKFLEIIIVIILFYCTIFTLERYINQVVSSPTKIHDWIWIFWWKICNAKLHESWDFAGQKFKSTTVLAGASEIHMCNTEACPNSVTLYRMRLLQLKDWCALEDYVRTVLQVCITKK